MSDAMKTKFARSMRRVFRPIRLGAACIGAWCFAGGAWASSGEIGPGTLSEIVLFPAIFATIAFLLWVLANHMQQSARMRMQLEFRLKLLERLDSGMALATLLVGERGAQVVQELLAGERPDLTHRVIATVRLGIVVVTTGAGFVILAVLNTLGGGAIFAAFAILLIAVGCGSLLAAFAAWRLGVRLGLTVATGSLEASGPQSR